MKVFLESLNLRVNGQLTLGELVAFSTYLGQLAEPVRRVGMIVPVLAMATAAGERVFEILDARSDVEEVPDARILLKVTSVLPFSLIQIFLCKGPSLIQMTNG